MEYYTLVYDMNNGMNCKVFGIKFLLNKQNCLHNCAEGLVYNDII